MSEERATMKGQTLRRVTGMLLQQKTIDQIEREADISAETARRWGQMLRGERPIGPRQHGYIIEAGADMARLYGLLTPTAGVPTAGDLKDAEADTTDGTVTEIGPQDEPNLRQVLARVRADIGHLWTIIEPVIEKAAEYDRLMELVEAARESRAAPDDA